MDNLDEINPNSIDSIVVVTPYSAVKGFGMERIGGIIKIYTSE